MIQKKKIVIKDFLLTVLRNASFYCHTPILILSNSLVLFITFLVQITDLL